MGLGEGGPGPPMPCHLAPLRVPLPLLCQLLVLLPPDHPHSPSAIPSSLTRMGRGLWKDQASPSVSGWVHSGLWTTRVPQSQDWSQASRGV